MWLIVMISTRALYRRSIPMEDGFGWLETSIPVLSLVLETILLSLGLAEKRNKSGIAAVAENGLV